MEFALEVDMEELSDDFILDVLRDFEVKDNGLLAGELDIVVDGIGGDLADRVLEFVVGLVVFVKNLLRIIMGSTRRKKAVST